MCIFKCQALEENLNSAKILLSSLPFAATRSTSERAFGFMKGNMHFKMTSKIRSLLFYTVKSKEIIQQPHITSSRLYICRYCLLEKLNFTYAYEFNIVIMFHFSYQKIWG